VTTNTTTRTPLHDLAWERSASGRSLRTRYKTLHISLWRRPQGGALNFTISGTLPAEITTVREAIGYLWTKLLCRMEVM